MATTKDKFVSDEKFKNYVSLVVALKFTKDGLKMKSVSFMCVYPTDVLDFYRAT